jgi:hypothetical protein
MSDEKDKPKDSKSQGSPPDDRGKRPTDPNELAKWIVAQTTNSCDKDDEKSTE